LEKYVDVVFHYDNLIAENNDPFRDAPPLKSYMDKWDGKVFIDEMQLSGMCRVLEIGIGTGRIAEKTAPCCKTLYGIDISPKTVERAKENLLRHSNIKLICADFLEYEFETVFDVVYSSLTLMHFCDKKAFFNKVYSILDKNGTFVLSTDKNQSEYIDMGTYKLKIFPDAPDTTQRHLLDTGFAIKRIIETEHAFIFVCHKK